MLLKSLLKTGRYQSGELAIKTSNPCSNESGKPYRGDEERVGPEMHKSPDA